MDAATLLAELARRGVTLEASGDRLRWKPAGAVPPNLRHALATYKPELFALLAKRERLVVCPECGAEMRRQNYVLEYGRAWWCSNGRCGLVEWIPDAQPS